MQIVKVKYFLGDSQELSAREYTYFSASQLAVGAVITVPVRDTTAKAQVTTIDVPESEIATFKDKVKVIPADGALEADLREAGAEVTVTQVKVTPTEPTTTAIIRVSPENDPVVLALSDEVRKLRDYALIRVIATDADLTPATDDLSLIAKVKKALTEKKIEYLKPIKAHVDAVTVAFDSIFAPINEADRVTRQKFNDYREAAKKRQAEAEAINREREALVQREAAFNGTGEITAPPPVEVPLAVKHVYTNVGSAAVGQIWKFKVVDFKLLPEEYKLPDEVKIGKVVRATKGSVAIPGVEMWQEDSIRVTAK